MSRSIDIPTDKFQDLYLEYLQDGFNSFNGWLLTLSDEEFLELHPKLNLDPDNSTDDEVDYQGNFIYITLTKSSVVTEDMVQRLSYGDLIDKWDELYGIIMASVNLIYLLKNGYIKTVHRSDIDNDWKFELTDLGHNQLNLPGEGFLKFSKN